MKKQKCSNCGYTMSFSESVIANVLKTVKDNNDKLIGINTVSNANNLKCPSCGLKGRWIREDE